MTETIKLILIGEFILSVIVLIAFFSLVSDVRKIKNILEDNNEMPQGFSSFPYEEDYLEAIEFAELREHQGKKVEALDYYKAAEFFLLKDEKLAGMNKKRMAQVAKKIAELKGE